MKHLLLSLVLLVTLNSQAADEGPHGGDTYAYEFSLLARNLVSFTSEKELKSIENLISVVKVYSDDSGLVQVNGQVVDAINYPSKKMIILNRNRWREKTLREKLILVIHEYFGVQKIELDTFEITHLYDLEINKVISFILENKAQSISYFSMERAYKPLYENKDSCNLKIKNVSRAIEKAREDALNKCEKETSLPCEVVSNELNSISSKQVPGMSYCNIGVLAKVRS